MRRECRPFTDCKRQIDGDEIKRQAQAGHRAEQLMAGGIQASRLKRPQRAESVARKKWKRGPSRCTGLEDDNSAAVAERLAEEGGVGHVRHRPH